MPSLTVVSRSPQKLDIRGRDSGIDLFWWLSRRCVVAIALLGWRESCVMEMGSCWIQEAEGSFGVVECHVVVVPEGFFRLKVFISEWHGHKVAISAGQTVETIGATYLGAAYLSISQWNVSPRHPAGPLHGKSEHSFKAACNARRGGGMLKMRALFNTPGCLMWGVSCAAAPWQLCLPPTSHSTCSIKHQCHSAGFESFGKELECLIKQIKRLICNQVVYCNYQKTSRQRKRDK